MQADQSVQILAVITKFREAAFKQFDAIAERFDGIDQRFDRLEDRVARMDDRLTLRIDGLERELRSFRAEVGARFERL